MTEGPYTYGGVAEQKPSTETRTVSSTGGEKGVKSARFDLVPARAEWLVAELYGKGAEKYTTYGECTCPVDAPQSATPGGSVDPATSVSYGNGILPTQIDSAPSLASGDAATRGATSPSPDRGHTGRTGSVEWSTTPTWPILAESAEQSLATSTMTTQQDVFEVAYATGATSGSATSKAGTPNTVKQHAPGCGATKVLQSGDRNWERGYEWSKSYGALRRHLNLWWQGEDLDSGEGGTGLPHLASVAWHALALLTFAETHPDFDDRPSTVERRQAEEERMAAAIAFFSDYRRDTGVQVA